MDIFNSLNEEQKTAVSTAKGPLLILAGAGSGKTRVITHRIAHIIHNIGTAPQSIFAVTFTNKAAQEMRERIVSLIGPMGNNVFIKTFHSASVAILRQYGAAGGINPSFTIYDRSDQESVMKEIIKNRLKLDPKKVRPQALVSAISAIKDSEEYISGAPVDSLFPEYPYVNFQEVFDMYHEILSENNAMDFNDLIINTVSLLRNNKEVLESLQRRWRYFMVDEYQDTNHAQYLITKYLSADSGNICVVGDDDQSIYSWRGADIRNILNFEKDYPGTVTVTLNKNYRSSKPILDAASGVIRNNTNRKEKNLQAVIGEGELVEIVEANNEYAEAEFAVNTIMKLKSQENLNNKDFAIFYRTNAQSRVHEDLLRRNGISYKIIGGLKFYDRKEIKDLLAYMKVIVNPQDSVSLARIINTPARGIGDTSVNRIREEAIALQKTMWDIVAEDLLTGRVPKGLAGFREVMNKLISASHQVPQTLSLPDFATLVYEETGYKTMLAEEPGIESRSRQENIEEFINSIYEYAEENREADVNSFLQDISLMTTEENPENSDPESTITLMTVHNAKGLEFPVVFLTGLEEEMFPHRLSMENEEGIEEERRLCYVGMTRAKERLFLSTAELRRSFNNVFRMAPSRFLDEIPSSTVKWSSYRSGGSDFSYGRQSAARSFTQKSPGSFTRQKPVAPKKEVPKEESVTGSFSISQKVLHPKYGPGKIISIDGTGDNRKLTIVFAVGKKSFLEKYTPLSPLN